MSKPFKQSFGKTSPSFLTLLFVIVFTFVLSGCGGGGGGQEPVSRELMLNKINEIQATERADNSDDDVVRDILNTAANQPRGLTSSALGPTVSSTSQNSSRSRR